MRRNLVKLGEDGFQALVKDVVDNLKPLLRDHEGATPWFRGVQRRYPSQRATPFVDAKIDFDLRTAIPSGGSTQDAAKMAIRRLRRFRQQGRTPITKYKWAYCFATSDVPNFGKPTRLI